MGESVLHTSVGDLLLRERVAYPNGGYSYFYERPSAETEPAIAVIIDDGICERPDGQPIFDYSLITSKQNEYVARYQRVYRFLAEDIAQIERFLHPVDSDVDRELAPQHTAHRADNAVASPLEMEFESHFANVYGNDSLRFLTREYAITDLEGHDRYIDYLVQTKRGLLGVEENGVTYHHPQIIGRDRYRMQLLKQNSCQHEGIKP